MTTRLPTSTHSDPLWVKGPELKIESLSGLLWSTSVGLMNMLLTSSDCFVVNCILQDLLRGLISKLRFTMALMTFWIAQQTKQQFNKKKRLTSLYLNSWEQNWCDFKFKGWIQVKLRVNAILKLVSLTLNFLISPRWVFVCLLWWTNDLSWVFSASLPVTAGIRLGVRIGIIYLLLRCDFKCQLIRKWRRAHEL